MAEFIGKTKHPVDDLSVPVLGGTFQVRELLVDELKGVKGILDQIRSVPMNGWFVMLAEDEAATEDVLALINDAFEYEAIAIGTLKSE